MKSFCLALCYLSFFSSFASGQAAPSDTSQKDDTVACQSARLVKMTASVTTQPHEVRHTTMVDTLILPDNVIIYQFLIRCGGVEYTSEYTPDKQSGNLPDAWWKGSAVVGIRVVKHKLYIKLPDGREVKSRIIRPNSSYLAASAVGQK
jgi:hypothetical protein